MSRQGQLARRLKRAIDLSIALPALAVLSPLMAILALMLRASTGSGAILRQRRAGLAGRSFELLKFRTMTEARDAAGNLLRDDQRVTRLGRLVRATSIDELPQLVNILRGEMSLVGPRPLPVPYERLYTPRERIRLRAVPGITGWAQINGRHSITFSQRLEYDAWYVENWSLGLDLKIIALTLPRLLRRSGVVSVQDLSAVDDRGFAELWLADQAAQQDSRPASDPGATS